MRIKLLLWFLKKHFIYLFIFRQRGTEGEREGNIGVWLLIMRPPLGTWPATQTCALTGNRTSYPLVCKRALNTLSHTNQSRIKLLLWLLPVGHACSHRVRESYKQHSKEYRFWYQRELSLTSGSSTS